MIQCPRCKGRVVNQFEYRYTGVNKDGEPIDLVYRSYSCHKCGYSWEKQTNVEDPT